MAGELSPGLSEPGNKESTGMSQQYILLSYALPNAYPVSDRKDHLSVILLEGGLSESLNVIPDAVMLGTGISLEMTS
jgi:hypothetical protein